MVAAVATRSPLPAANSASPPRPSSTTTTTTTATSSPIQDDGSNTAAATYTVDIVNLNNLLSRLEQHIFSSSADLKLLQQSHLHRARVGANVEYAHTLFTRIERSLPLVKSPETRHQRTTDLAKKRARLTRVKERFDEIKMEEYSPVEEDANGEGGEDLLAGIEPVMELEELEDATGGDERAAAATTTTAEAPMLRQRRLDAATTTAETSTTTAQSSTSSPISARATATTTGFRPSTAAFSTTSEPAPTPANAIASASTEATLSTHRAEQESLTDSLVNLARQLKASSQAFQSSLANEKSILDRAVEGLDRNVTGLESAGQRMGVLRRMSEGRGWWGRMLMYAWIFALWLVAIALVFLGPKLRF